MRNLNEKTLNKEDKQGTRFKITITPKGEKEKITVYVWAKNELEAANFMILNKFYGHIESIEAPTLSEMLAYA